MRRSSSEGVKVNTKTVSFSLHLLVLPGQVPLYDRRKGNTKTGKDDLQDHGHGVSRLVSIGEEVGRDDVAKMTKDVDDGTTSGTLLRGLTKSRNSPSILQSVGGETTSGIQEGHGVSDCRVAGSDGHDKTDDGEGEGDDDVKTSILSTIRVP